MENIESIQKIIDTIVLQIELLSNRCQMEANRKSPKTNLMEYSSGILQLSKTLSELILIKKVLESNRTEDLMGLINGRMR